jgi:hypothetical protein
MGGWGLNEHLFQARGFDLLKFFELEGVFGNQLVERAEVGADFPLLVSHRNSNGDLHYSCFRDVVARNTLSQNTYTFSERISSKKICEKVGVEIGLRPETETEAIQINILHVLRPH